MLDAHWASDACIFIFSILDKIIEISILVILRLIINQRENDGKLEAEKPSVEERERMEGEGERGGEGGFKGESEFAMYRHLGTRMYPYDQNLIEFFSTSTNHPRWLDTSVSTKFQWLEIVNGRAFKFPYDQNDFLNEPGAVRTSTNAKKREKRQGVPGATSPPRKSRNYSLANSPAPVGRQLK